MASNDSTVRRLAATVASNTYRAFPDRPRRRAAGVVPDHLREAYSHEVDPNRQLDEVERLKRASAAWRRDVALHLLDLHRRDSDGGAA